MRFSDKEVTDIITHKNLSAIAAPGGEAGGGEGPGGPPPLPGGTAGGGELPAPDETPTPGEEGPPPGAEEPAPELQGTLEQNKNELLEEIFVRVLGKDFILKNQEDFFKIVKQLREENKSEKMRTKLMEDMENIFTNKEKSIRISNNIRHQIIMNEFSGLSMNNQKMTLYERVIDNKFQKKSVQLNEG